MARMPLRARARRTGWLLLFGFDVEDDLGHGARRAQRVAIRIERLALNYHSGRANGRSDNGRIRFVVASRKRCTDQSSKSDEACCSRASPVAWSKFRDDCAACFALSPPRKSRKSRRKNREYANGDGERGENPSARR